MRYVVAERHGGAEALEVREGPLPEPGQGEVLVEVAAIGVNYVDIYQRKGAAPTPLRLGVEGAGRVVAVGAGVTSLTNGDRVAWKSAQGSYAEAVVVREAELVPVPDGVSDELAAAAILQGLTAEYLTSSTYPVQSGDLVLVHAAAGGVGLLLTQMAKQRGAQVIGTVSSEEKERLARQAGVHHVIRYDRLDVASAVREATNGEGVAAVYDGVGAATFDASLASLRPRGYLVVFGAASGPVPPFDLQRLNSGGSLFITRPSLAHYTRTRDELESRAAKLFDGLVEGALNVHIGGRYPLAGARTAHEDLEGRRTTGKLLLSPH